MASIGHIAIGMAAASAYHEGRLPRWSSLGLWSALSLLPDVDVIGFARGVDYAAPWGHRGATHSLTSSVAVGLTIGLAARWLKWPGRRMALFATLVVASHAVLDTMTDGGLGCALFWPFDLTRYFAPWRPIPVAPIGLAFLSPYGVRVAAAELVLFSPVLLLVFRPLIWPLRSNTTRLLLALWLVLSSVATSASDSAMPPALRTGQPPGQQHDDELTQLRRNAERGDRHAQFSLGLIYEAGEGISRDDAQAAEWYQKAADQGHPQAQYHLGLMYVDGRGRARDNATGVRWFRQAADNGLAEAQYAMGLASASGRGVPKDDVKAYAWYRQAAEQGLAPAQFSLGTMYHQAKGVPQSFTQAIQWYRKAAVQGDANAQYELGVMFRNGEGVTRDDAEAAKWYGRAAEQGHAGAQFSLGLCLRDGQGVAQDIVNAHVWFGLAATRTSDESQRATYAAARDALEARMTSEQLSAARERQRWWAESFDRRTK